jgi:hypothetical protein
LNNILPNGFVAITDDNIMDSIAIYPDLICPWCYIGKRRMEEALRQLSADLQVSRSWHPFQLNPDLPREGLNRKMYRSKKFGSWEQSQAMDAQVAAAGKSVGIEFRYDLQTHTPNTFDSHRLVWLERALKCGFPERFAQQALGHNSKAVYRAYIISFPTVLSPLRPHDPGRSRIFSGAPSRVPKRQTFSCR